MVVSRLEPAGLAGPGWGCALRGCLAVSRPQGSPRWGRFSHRTTISSGSAPGPAPSVPRTWPPGCHSCPVLGASGLWSQASPAPPALGSAETRATRGSEGSAATRVFPEPMSLSAGRGLGPPSVRHAPTQLDEGQPRGGLRARLSVGSLFMRISGPTTGLRRAPPCRDGRKPAPEIRPSSERTASLAKH